MWTVRGRMIFPDTWSIKEKNDARGTPIVTHSEDLEPLYVTQLTIPYTYDVIDIDHTVHVLVDNTDGIEPIKFQEGQVIAHSEVLYEETPEKVQRILRGSTYNMETETQAGEYKLHPQENIGRFDYVEKINVKSDEEGTEDFCRDLLIRTEPFWSKHNFDLGKFDRKARMTLKTTTPVWDKYRPINPNKEAQAQEIIDQLEKNKLISRANSPYCA